MVLWTPVYLGPLLSFSVQYVFLPLLITIAYIFSDLQTVVHACSPILFKLAILFFLYSYKRDHYVRFQRICFSFGCVFGRHCPFVIEAIIALAELGVAAKDIISLFLQVCYGYHSLFHKYMWNHVSLLPL